MPIYRIEFTPRARKQVDALDSVPRRRVDAAIVKLADVPFPAGVTALQGEAAVYRVRVGDYRILYTVEAGHLLVLIIEVGHRRDIYGRR